MKTRKHSFIARLFRFVFRLCLFLAALIAVLVFYARSEHGRATIARKASEALSRTPGRTILLDGLGGNLPFHATLSRLSIADRDGIWFDVRDVEVRYAVRAWRPLRVTVTGLSAGSVRLERKPARTGAASSGFRMPALPSVEMQKIHVGSLAFGPTILGRALELQVDGEVWPGAITVRATERAPGPAHTIDATLLQRGDELELRAKAVATSDAWWLRLARIPTGLVYGIDAEASMTARAGEAWPTGRISLDAGILSLTGTPSTLVTLIGTNAQLRGDVKFEQGMIVRFTNVAIAAAVGSVRGSGAVIPAERRVDISWAVDGADLALANPRLFGMADAEGAFRLQPGGWDVRAGGVYTNDALQAPFAFAVSGSAGVVRVTEFSANAAGIAASGAVSIATASRLLDGSIRAHVEDFAAVTLFTNRALVGAADVSVELSAKDAGQQFRARVEHRGVTLRADGSWKQGDLVLDAATTPIPMSMLPVATNLGGQVEGSLRVEGRLESPVVAAHVAYTEAGAAKRPPIQMIVDAHAGGGAATGCVALAAGALVNLQTHFMVPFDLGLKPFRFALAEGQRARADLKGEADLAQLNGWIVPSGQQLTGKLSADLRCEGEWPSLHGKGKANLASGSYTHDAMGLELRGIEGELALRGSRLVLERASGSVGGGGSISVTGELAVAADEGLRFRIDVVSDHARLVRRDDVKATVSGRLALEGGAGGASLTGDVVLDDVEMLLDRMGRRAPPSLEVIDGVSVAQAQRKGNGNGKTESFLRSGEVRIDLGDRFVVRGRGLESTWGGRLKLAYADDAWGLGGRLQVRRGTYALLSRPFHIREGTVLFDGKLPPQPVLELTAEYERSDITAVAEIRGLATDPIITLTSDPPLPEDEVLAYVLFGRSLSAITPLQGARLVLAAQELRGGRVPGLVDKARGLIPVDDIDVRESPQQAGATEIVATKNLSERLYIEVNRVLGTGRSGIVAEYELTPHWSLETDAGPSLRPGVGVNWKVNY